MKRAFAVVLAFVLGCGSIVGALLAYEVLPDPTGVLADVPAETTYPVTIVPFRDQRALSLTPTFAEGTPLRSPTDGVVTWSSCTPGQPMTSGAAAFRVNDTPVIALASDLPFFRDLHRGDTGHDVEALRRALAALGFDVRPSGGFTYDLARALSSLQRRESTAHTDGDFVLADVMWMPAPAPALASCGVQVGQTLSAGSTVATTVSRLTALTISGQSAGALVPGDRSVQVLGVDVIVPDSGVVEDPDALRAVETSPLGREQLAGAKSTPVSATSALTTPLRVAAVPVGSVFDVHGTKGCVASGSTTSSVTIVGTSLGMSLVTFDADTPPAVLLQPGKETCDAH